MKYYLLLAIFLSAFITALSQTDSNSTTKSTTLRLATIYKMDGKVVNGWFYKLDSNNMYLLQSKKKPKLAAFDNAILINNGSLTVDAVNINTINIKKKNAGLKGALIGLGVGAAIGAIIGFVSGDDPVAPTSGGLIDGLFKMTADEKAVAYGLTGGLAGAIIGGVSSALMKKTFIIGGNKDAYHNVQEELNKLAMVKF